MAVLPEPLLQESAPGSRPQPVDHGQETDRPLGQGRVVLLLGKEGHDGAREPLWPDVLRLNAVKDAGQLVEGSVGKRSQVTDGPCVKPGGLTRRDPADDIPKKVTRKRGQVRQLAMVHLRLLRRP